MLFWAASLQVPEGNQSHENDFFPRVLNTSATSAMLVSLIAVMASAQVVVVPPMPQIGSSGNPITGRTAWSIAVPLVYPAVRRATVSESGLCRLHSQSLRLCAPCCLSRAVGKSCVHRGLHRDRRAAIRSNRGVLPGARQHLLRHHCRTAECAKSFVARGARRHRS